ncbi:MAG: hypothetical protein HY514_03260 [Candidatus Aenigmarchaeota archaeon]|nr:hypothetical protein [Candidatus Aenigmarchaeota archaeon]
MAARSPIVEFLPPDKRVKDYRILGLMYEKGEKEAGLYGTAMGIYPIPIHLIHNTYVNENGGFSIGFSSDARYLGINKSNCVVLQVPKGSLTFRCSEVSAVKKRADGSVLWQNPELRKMQRK